MTGRAKRGTNMSRSALTDVAINSLLQQRHSPYAFDPSREVSAEDTRALFEAARDQELEGQAELAR